MVRNVDDAEDLTIEAFTKAFKSLDKFRQDYTFSTWLFRIATNNCIDFIRKKKNVTVSLDGFYVDVNGEESGMDVRDTQLNPQEETIKLQDEAQMRAIVAKLPPKYRKIVSLRYFEELSYEEIATELDIPLGTVKAQLHRAKELLLDMVKDKKLELREKN